jgi:hypothetical protein
MNGHSQIIELRKKRLKPEIVFINDFSCKTDWFEHKDHATVSIMPTEAIETLDMRFLNGLTVSVASFDEKRAKGLFEACKAAGAKTVVAVHQLLGKKPYEQDGWMGVAHG